MPGPLINLGNLMEIDKGWLKKGLGLGRLKPFY